MFECNEKTTTPLAEFVRPTIVKLGFWRFVFGFLLVILFWILGGIIVLFTFALLFVDALSNIDSVLAFFGEGSFEGTVTGLFALLSSFIGIWIGIWVVGKILTKQRFGTFFSPRKGDYFGLLVLGVVIGAIFSAISVTFFATNLVRSDLEVSKWMMSIIPLILLIIVQATAEELLFRGYLLQQLAARYRSWIVWALIPSLVFGSLHFDPELADYGGLYYVASTTMIGLVFCALVWRTGSLWMSAGLHVMVNIVAFTAVIPKQLSSGTELWLIDLPTMTPLFHVDISTSVVLLILILSPFGKIFGPGGRYEIPKQKS